MSGEFVQEIVLKIRADGTSEIQKVTDALHAVKPAGTAGAGGVTDMNHALDELRSHATGLAGPFAGVLNMVGSAGPWAIAAGGAMAVGGALKHFIEAGIEAEKIQIDLAAAIKVAGSSWAAVGDEIEATVASLKKMSYFTESEIKGALESMITLTGNVTTSQNLMAATANMAAARHMELGDAANMVAKALEGSSMAMRRQGIILDEHTKEILKWANETERAVIWQDILNSKFDGRAQAALESTAGKIRNMKAEWHDLAEEVGGNLLNAFKEFAGIMEKVDKFIIKGPEIKAAILRGINGMSPYGAAGAQGEEGMGPGPEPGAPTTTREQEALDRKAAEASATLRHNEEEAAKKAEAARVAYQAGLEAMVGTGEKAAISQRMLGDAIAIVGARFHDVHTIATAFYDTLDENATKASGKFRDLYAGAEAFYELIDKNSKDAARLGNFIPEGLTRSISYFLGGEKQRTFKDLADSMAPLLDSTKAVGEALERWDIALEKAQSHIQNVSRRALEGFEKFQDPSGAQTNPFAAAGIAANDAMIEGFQKRVKEITDATDFSNAQSIALWTTAMNSASDEFGHSIELSGKEFAKSAETFGKHIVAPLADFFSNALAQGFGGALAAAFTKGVSDGSKDLAGIFGKIILQGFGGVPERSQFEMGTAKGDADFAAAEEASRVQQKKIGSAIQAVIEVGGAAMHAADVLSGKVHESAFQTIASFTAMGASVGSLVPAIGTVIGAIAGLVVGAVVAILAPSVGKDYKYATMGVKDGVAWLDPKQNISNKEASDMLNALQTTVDAFSSAYIKILMKFPEYILASMDSFSLNIDPVLSKAADSVGRTTRSWWQKILDPANITGWLTGTGTLNVGGLFGMPIKGGDGPRSSDPNANRPYDFNYEPSRGFPDAFAQFVGNTLPRAVAEQFKATMSGAFTDMGMTTDRFGKIWESLRGMDPKAAIKVLDDMATALINFRTLNVAVENFNNGPGGYGVAGGANGWDANGGSFMGGTGKIDPKTGKMREEGVSDFIFMVSEATTGLFKMGDAIGHLAGPEKIAMTAQLSTEMTKMWESLITYLNRLNEMSKALSAGIADMAFNARVQIAGIVTPLVRDPKLYPATPKGDTDFTNAQAQNEVDAKMRQSALYEKRYNEDQAKLANAKALGLSPDDIQKITTDAGNMLNAMLQLDPAKRLDWFLAQLDVLDAAQKAAYTAIGEQAKTAVEKVLVELEPVVNSFRGLSAVVVPATATFDAALRGASDELDNFTRSVAGAGGGGGGGGTNATMSASATIDGPATTQAPPQEVVVTIEVDDPSGFVRSVRSRRVAIR